MQDTRDIQKKIMRGNVASFLYTQYNFATFIQMREQHFVNSMRCEIIREDFSILFISFKEKRNQAKSLTFTFVCSLAQFNTLSAEYFNFDKECTLFVPVFFAFSLHSLFLLNCIGVYAFSRGLGNYCHQPPFKNCVTT